MSLQLDTRQRAMLTEMGIRLWAPKSPPAPAAPEVTIAPDTGADRSRKTGAEGPFDTDAVARQGAAVAAPPSTATPPLARPTSAPTSVPVAARAPAAPGPRPTGIDTMDWPALEAAVAGCRACMLCEGRTQTVFGVGSRTADWMVVGEAPGENEDRQGQPFVGQAGKLLDNMLAAMGLSRRAGDAPETEAASAVQTGAGNQKDSEKQGVYIANVLKCRPPGNRNPQPDEVAQCEPYLRRQVALVQPKVILAMGRFAVQSLLNTTEPIGRLRGRVHDYQGVPVVVTYHPAYLLRALPEKAKAWQDLCLALSLQGGSAPAA